MMIHRAIRIVLVTLCTLTLQPAMAGDLAQCETDRLPVQEGEGFEKSRYHILFADAEPGHTVQDYVVNPGDKITVEAKFAYGDVSKDLEESRVSLRLYDCDRWQLMGEAVTDDDGRSRITLDTSELKPGHYALAHVVSGDGSVVHSRLSVLPRGTQIVVFDIDGTLTTENDEAVEEFLFKDPATEWPGAVELTRAWHDKGVEIVYLTGRPYWLIPQTRAWLARKGFAPGTVRSTDRHRDTLPDDDSVGRFKADYLKSLQALGMQIQSAYGNASTDIFAYKEAGVSAEQIWIIGPNGGHDGTQKVSDGWDDHVQVLGSTR